MSDASSLSSIFEIRCDDEGNLPLSNSRDIGLWDTLGKLVEILARDSGSSESMLLWKAPHHLASAKEPYAWRATIEEIKDSDLKEKCVQSRAKFSGEELTLITDKPAMLKIAGEITNALLHSYTRRHRITFAQKRSKVPSFIAL